MMEKIEAYRCTCWLDVQRTERGPKRCAKCKSRKWNTPEKPHQKNSYPDIDPFSETISKRSPTSCLECFALNGNNTNEDVHVKKITMKTLTFLILLVGLAGYEFYSQHQQIEFLRFSGYVSRLITVPIFGLLI